MARSVLFPVPSPVRTGSGSKGWMAMLPILSALRNEGTPRNGYSVSRQYEACPFSFLLDWMAGAGVVFLL